MAVTKKQQRPVKQWSVDAEKPSLQEIRDAIPKHCWERSSMTAMYYVIRDVSMVVALGFAASKIHLLESQLLQQLAWSTYWLLQGWVFVGVWILAHECGHQALFNHTFLNDFFGFFMHSFVLVPFFSWRYSHALHHRYHNNMEKDTSYCPVREGSFLLIEQVKEWVHASEDAPIVNLCTLIFHQVIGFQGYLLCNLTASETSLERKEKDPKSWIHNHFHPDSGVFTKAQIPYVMLSNVGILMVFAALWWFSTIVGWQGVGAYWGIPYLAVNHWIVAITYLHHHHPSTVRFEADKWTYRDGALNTVDRDFGWIGRNIFHGVIEWHVVHHLFTKIPFYHAEEATEAIAELLGDNYLRDDSSFLGSLYDTFSTLQFVKPSETHPGVLVWN